jgi:DNA polymerase-1
MDVIKQEKPDHLAVAFDKGSDLRNEIFPEYKAHRDATPEYQIAVPYIQNYYVLCTYPS